MAEWQNGGMAEWQNDGMAEWRNSRTMEWQNGGMTEWWKNRAKGNRAKGYITCIGEGNVTKQSSTKGYEDELQAHFNSII
jgi:hypothetical protein